VYQAIAQRQAHLQSKKIAKELAFFPPALNSIRATGQFFSPPRKKN
jgi:hypothetical protein